MINLNKSKEALLDYYMIDELILQAEEAAWHPETNDDDQNVGGSSNSKVNNAVESQYVKALTNKKVANLKEIRDKVGIVIVKLPGLEKEVMSLLYQTTNRKVKSYKEVSQITRIPTNYLKSIDDKVKLEVGRILGY